MSAPTHLVGPLVALALLACGGREDPPTRAPPEDAGPASAPEDARATRPAIDVSPIITRLKDRQQCNRVTGCAPLTALLSAGRAAVEPLVGELARGSGADAYWVIAALDGLGQLGDPSVVPTLLQHARDRRWEVQVAAMRALGRLAPHLDAATRTAIVTELRPGLTAPRVDAARLGALHFALARLDDEAGDAYRRGLLTLLPAPERDAVMAMPSPFLDVVIELAGELRMGEALPAIRLAALSDNRMVAVHAAEILGRMRDTGGVPFLLQRVEDEHPTIRKTALAALEQVTGSRFESATAWRAWAATHGLADIPGAEGAGEDAQGSGGSSAPTGTGQGPADP